MKIWATFFALILVSGCATPPTMEERAKLDYGSCPSTHVEKIKSHFQSNVLTAYEGEPVIWPPQKFSYTNPPINLSNLAEGGKLQAGYLVLVMANKTRGFNNTDYPHGKHIYGFIFKNDELVRVVSPASIAGHRTKSDVGPLPVDEKDWKIGFSEEKGNQAIVEWVRDGQSVQNWSELITLQTFFRVTPNVTPGFIAKNRESSYKTRCARVTQTTLSVSETEAIIELATAECAPNRDEYHIEKYIRGPYTLHRVAYSKTAPLSNTERERWTALIKKAAFVGDCK